MFLAGINGYVTQESYLFNATLRSNLQYGRPDASQEQIEAADRAAFIQQWISELPDAYDTVVGGFETRPRIGVWGRLYDSLPLSLGSRRSLMASPNMLKQ